LGWLVVEAVELAGGLGFFPDVDRLGGVHQARRFPSVRVGRSYHFGLRTFVLGPPTFS
jgi:hypothetical protein